MNSIFDDIRNRRSVRSYNGKAIEASVLEKLVDFGKCLDNPFGIDVQIKFLDGEENGLVCPVISGTSLFAGGKVKVSPMANVAFGYSFEKFVLYAQSLGVGTVWLGGTMNRAAFEKAMELDSDEIMPCASPLGYAADKMTIKEIMMRKAVKADWRMDFENLFFEGDFGKPFSKSSGDKLAEILEMVRFAPSAVNKQPWRLVLRDNSVHFYLKRSRNFSHSERLDMQMIDMGIALCHFELAANAAGINTEFFIKAPDICFDCETEYIASYLLN